MKLINLELVKELLYNDYDSIECMVYTKQLNDDDLFAFYELQDIKDLKSVCSRIVKNVSNLHHIDFKITYDDSDFDQVTIYNK